MSREDRTYGRREFFGALRDRARLEGHVLHNEFRGVRMMGLEDLETAPDDIIRGMAPVVRAGLSIRLDADGVLHVTRGEERGEETIRELTPHEWFVFRQMDGELTNEDLSRDLAHTHALSEDEAFAMTRALFVELARRLVCQPATA